MPFTALRELVEYFDQLGVSHLYLSPVFAARPDSHHGYDVVDPTVLNPQLGSEAELQALADALRERGMGLVLDIVPNHMCVVGGDNRWWADVLEDGPSSPCAAFFDIDWNPPKADLADKILLPFLGEQYGRELERGAIRAVREGGGFLAECPATRLPLAPKSWPRILVPALERARASLPADDSALVELESILTALAHLPSRTETQPERVQERQREKGVVRRRLERLLEESAALRAAVDAALEEINGRPGDPRSFDSLEALLGDQGYRLSHWRVASDEINYRRFFDVNELAAIRVEEDGVFEAVHQLPLRLVEQGLAAGLRIDHADGLYDPLAYLARLRQVPFVVVEKILCGSERLPGDWPVAGTTGYEFLAAANGLFVEPASRAALLELYERFTGIHDDYADVAYESKKLALQVALSAELTVLARRLDRISEQHRYSRDFTLASMEDALEEVIACFPVYRTYIRRDEAEPGAADRAHVEAALAEARRRNPATSASLFDFVGDVLLFRDPEGLDEPQRAERRDFVMRFQQLTGPVMAKGVEDTAGYRHFPLASLSEVGADAGGWGLSPAEFHAFALERQRRWPLGLSATSSHDTKRDEDVRARLNVLSEIPLEWEQALQRLRATNPARRADSSARRPDANDEYLLYQTLFASWPPGQQAPGADYVERIQAYMLKAIREAKRHTSWVSPNARYELAMREFVAAALQSEQAQPFLDALRGFVGRWQAPGLLNAISQALIKIAAPGVPDFYQGTELPEFRLVDPDNRGRVDFDRRARLLAALGREAQAGRAGLVERLLAGVEDGRLKLYLSSRCLAFRREHRELFAAGEYLGLETVGERRAQLLAFARRSGEAAVLALAGRGFASLPGLPIGNRVWGRSAVVVGEGLGTAFRDVITDRELRIRRVGGRLELPLGEAFAHAPFALLERVEA